ncbi:hypothetical protein AMTRI_Chr03g44300 [Amborella trichopoda]
MQFPTNRVKQTSAVAEVSRVSNERELSFVETKGTDMPPEKFHPRPVNLSVNGKSDSMPFGKLMQKFVVEDEPEVDGKGKQIGKGTVSSNPKLQQTFDEDIGLSKQRTPFRPPLKIGATNLCSSIKNSGSQTTETTPEGIESTPEKLQARPRSSRFFKKEESNSVSFESLMGKFVVEDEPEGDEKRSTGTSSNLKLEPPFDKDNDAVEFSASLENGGSQSIETVREVSRPETPAMRPLVPDLGLGSGIGSYGGASENIGSEFEWLNPSSIRGSNKRRPGDPLYDKRILYIPPDALNKMSASQRPYWTVKSQYMDVVLVFKVGKFYELYELDAEIGHKELDWKMTFSGVGKCRQVGISESGIDDAVQKLIAHGYKVARMEQTKTADHAKATGGASARKLVHVLTPSTTSDGNIGPHAIHLLALKEGCSGPHGGSSPVYGFAFLDCAALKFWVGSLSDDASSSSALGALLMHVSPKDVLYENGGFSKQTQQALKRFASTGVIVFQSIGRMLQENCSMCWVHFYICWPLRYKQCFQIRFTLLRPQRLKISDFRHKPKRTKLGYFSYKNVKKWIKKKKKGMEEVFKKLRFISNNTIKKIFFIKNKRWSQIDRFSEGTDCRFSYRTDYEIKILSFLNKNSDMPKYFMLLQRYCYLPPRIFSQNNYLFRRSILGNPPQKRYFHMIIFTQLIYFHKKSRRPCFATLLMCSTKYSLVSQIFDLILFYYFANNILSPSNDYSIQIFSQDQVEMVYTIYHLSKSPKKAIDFTIFSQYQIYSICIFSPDQFYSIFII